MTKTTSGPAKPPFGSRQARLAEALRENLKRRKSQARERRQADSKGPAGDGSERPAPPRGEGHS